MNPEEVKTFDVLIEIPKGSRNKYEYDFNLHKMDKSFKIKETKEIVSVEEVIQNANLICGLSEISGLALDGIGA